MTILPPNATAMESAFDLADAARLAALPVPVGDVWNPWTCPASLLPWLAWGVSIDIWDTSWPEQVKREAIAGAIEEQRRKGTPAAVRKALDRIDPLIGLTEWFEDRENLDRYTFRLDLPDRNTSAIEYDAPTINQLLRDIQAVKPLRAHVVASYRIHAQAQIGIVSAIQFGGISRFDIAADDSAAQDPAWSTYLQDQDGQPLQDQDGNFLEAA